MEGSTNKPKKFPYDYSIIAPLWLDFNGATVYQRQIPLPTSPSEKVRTQDQQDLDVSSSLVAVTVPQMYGKIFRGDNSYK